MPDDTRTKAELLRDLETAKSDLAAAWEERDAWRNARRKDKEAAAIDDCVRALDVLKESNRGGIYPRSNPGDVRRILRYLAERYGVAWYDPPPIDCGQEGLT